MHVCSSRKQMLPDCWDIPYSQERETAFRISSRPYISYQILNCFGRNVEMDISLDILKPHWRKFVPEVEFPPLICDVLPLNSSTAGPRMVDQGTPAMRFIVM